MSYSLPLLIKTVPQEGERPGGGSVEQQSFTDAEKHIRLLSIVSGDSDDSIECEIIVANADDVPLYGAISYTWGSPEKSRSIQVDGEEVLVGQNCYYALWQAKHHELHDFYWIDALCIDQEDLAEKSLQVRVTGDIFKRAACILICVGPHADGSENLFEIFNRLDVYIFHPTRPGVSRRRYRDEVLALLPHRTPQATSLNSDVLNAMVFDVVQAMGPKGDIVQAFRRFLTWEIFPVQDDHILYDPHKLFGLFLQWALELPSALGSRLQSALIFLYHQLCAFREREYWYPVWTAQEMCLTSQARVMCGNSSFPWSHLAPLIEEFSRVRQLAAAADAEYPPGSEESWVLL